MLLELMSNGTLSELPYNNAPNGIILPDKSSVMLLLPNHKYLIGTQRNGTDEWIYASDKPDTQSQKVYLYDNENLSLPNDDTSSTIIPKQTVRELRRELFMQLDPPGQHSKTVLLLRTFMRDNPALKDDVDFLDEKKFSRYMKNDITLNKAYWTLRFALSRNEMEEVSRLKAWLKADPSTFANPEYSAKIWFSLLGLPDDDTMNELEELSFTKLELQRMISQGISPVMLYNAKSGWLVLGRFGRFRETIFFVWGYFNHDMWTELRERKKMRVNDILLALWCELDTTRAMEERKRYKGADTEK